MGKQTNKKVKKKSLGKVQKLHPVLFEI